MATTTAIRTASGEAMQAELEQELRQAEEDFMRGDFVELTVEQLDRAIAAGEWPWPDESSGQAPRSVGLWRGSASGRGRPHTAR